MIPAYKIAFRYSAADPVLMSAPLIGVPTAEAIAITPEKPPSLPPSLSIGDICAMAAGPTDMNIPLKNPI